MKRLSLLLLFLVLAGLPATSAVEAEETPRPERGAATYRIEYVLVELEAGRSVNERTFSMTVNEGTPGEMRTGSRIPIIGSDGSVKYIEVGLRLTGRLVDRGGDLLLDTELEMSTALPEVGIDTRGNPVIRSRTLKTGSRSELGKKIVIATIDDLSSPKRLQLEVTVSRLP